MTFLEALHASRKREAAREIRRYRHLIDEANAQEIRHAIARAHAKASRRAYSSAAASPPRDARPASPLATLLTGMRMWTHAARRLVPLDPHRAQAQARLEQ